MNPKKGKGTAIPSQEKYQLAPAVTKNAPDKNLDTSFQLIFININGRNSLNLKKFDEFVYYECRPDNSSKNSNYSHPESCGMLYIVESCTDKPQSIHCSRRSAIYLMPLLMKHRMILPHYITNYYLVSPPLIHSGTESVNLSINYQVYDFLPFRNPINTGRIKVNR